MHTQRSHASIFTFMPKRQATAIHMYVRVTYNLLYNCKAQCLISHQCSHFYPVTKFPEFSREFPEYFLHFFKVWPPPTNELLYYKIPQSYCFCISWSTPESLTQNPTNNTWVNNYNIIAARLSPQTTG